MIHLSHITPECAFLVNGFPPFWLCGGEHAYFMLPPRSVCVFIHVCYVRLFIFSFLLQMVTHKLIKQLFLGFLAHCVITHAPPSPALSTD